MITGDFYFSMVKLVVTEMPGIFSKWADNILFLYHIFWL